MEGAEPVATPPPELRIPLTKLVLEPKVAELLARVAPILGPQAPATKTDLDPKMEPPTTSR